MDESILSSQDPELIEVRQQIRQAMRMFPHGDADFSNSVERKAPLAAWIASPESERPARWKRIADVLPLSLIHI